MADLISNAQKMIMLSSDATRFGLRIPELQDIGAYLKSKEKLMTLALKPVNIMPPCIFIPRILDYNLDLSPEMHSATLALMSYQRVSGTKFPGKLPSGNTLRLNPFFCLLKVSDMPQKPRQSD
jgi:hypothetical protein